MESDGGFDLGAKFMKYFGHLYHNCLECEAIDRHEARLKMKAKLIELIENDSLDISMVVWDKELHKFNKDKGNGDREV
jgi:hypothetical protein